jgi:hypothetical protein
MTFRAQVTFQGRSGIAEDQFVNTFYVDSVSNDGPSVATTLGPIFANMYNQGSGSASIASALSNFIDRSTGASLVKFYNMSEAKPRTPYVFAFTLDPATPGTGDLPEEVAVCGSFHGAPPRSARRRGRTYFGPFNDTALGNDPDPAGFGPSRPNDLLRQAIAVSQKGLLDSIDAIPGFDWVVYSPTGGTTTKVVGGWIDDAWDTQRRRGVDPAQRIIWEAGGIQ